MLNQIVSCHACWTAARGLPALATLTASPKMDLSGVDFADITDLSPLYVMDDLTDLWLVATQNVDANDLDRIARQPGDHRRNRHRGHPLYDSDGLRRLQRCWQ